jgi:uncharacterized alpha-E superfamily protein
MYWTSRYLERAEHTARLLDLNLNLMLDQALMSYQITAETETAAATAATTVTLNPRFRSPAKAASKLNPRHDPRNYTK